MDKLHQKYNLRPRNRNIITTPVKKILPKGETDEATSKAIEKKIVKIKNANIQSTKTKLAETPVNNTGKVEVPVAETKTSQKKN
jgi:predicted type IV restriction endonuclease